MSEPVSSAQMLPSFVEAYELRGEAVVREYCAKYPHAAERFEELAATLRRLNPSNAGADVPDVPPFAERPEVGQMLGRYRLRERLGAGGMGTVYRAVDTQLHDREVALKCMKPEFLLVEGMEERFHKEVRAASQLDHPSLCQVLDTGMQDGMPFMVMPLISGETLAAWIARMQGLSSRERTGGELLETVHIVEQVARALHVAHEQGLVHRDVKPSNIMVRSDGEPVLLDFGLVFDESSVDEALTRVGTQLGTCNYMSPEQFGIGSRPDRCTDVYSLGIVLYECLALRQAFAGADRRELERRILTENPEPVRRADHRISKDLAAVVETAINKAPRHRYATALDFAEDLRRVRERRPTEARAAGWGVRCWRWSERNRALAALFVVLILGLATVAALFVKAQHNATEAQRLAARVAVEQAKNHIRLGAWGAAERALHAAESTGHADQVDVDLGRAQVFESTNRQGRAAELVQQLARRSDLGPRRGEVELIRVSLASAQQTKESAAEIRALLTSETLSESDRLWAKSMVAESAIEAVELLRKARQIAPFDPRINDLYGNLLIVSGDLRGAREFARQRLVYDASNLGVAVYAALVLPDWDPDGFLSRQPEDTRSALRRWIEFMQRGADLVREFDRVQIDSLIREDFGSNHTLFLKYVGFILQAKRLLAERDVTLLSEVSFRVPPVVSLAFRDLAKSVGSVLTLDLDGLFERLDQAHQRIGDGIYVFGAGRIALMRKDIDSAEKRFLAALERPSFVIGKATILFHLLDVRWRRCFAAKPGEARQASARSAVKTLLRLVDGGEFEWTRRRVRYLHEVAEKLGADAIARELAARLKRMGG